MDGNAGRYVVEEIGEGGPDLTAVDAVALVSVCRHDLFQSRERTEDHIAIVFIQLGNENIGSTVIGEQLSLLITSGIGGDIIACGKGIQLGHKMDGLTHEIGIRITQELDEVITETKRNEVGDRGLFV